MCSKVAVVVGGCAAVTRTFGFELLFMFPSFAAYGSGEQAQQLRLNNRTGLIKEEALFCLEAY